MDLRKADFVPHGLKYMHKTENADHQPTQPPTMAAATLLLNKKTMTSSEWSCMDPFQGQVNITISRIMDKCNYSVFNITSTPQMKAGTAGYVKTGK